MAFVGYCSVEDASAACKYFQNTYIDTSKLSIEVCSSHSTSQQQQQRSGGSSSGSSSHKSMVIANLVTEQHYADCTGPPAIVAMGRAAAGSRVTGMPAMKQQHHQYQADMVNKGLCASVWVVNDGSKGASTA